MADVGSDWKGIFLALLGDTCAALIRSKESVETSSTQLSNYKRHPYNVPAKRPYTSKENPVPEQEIFTERYNAESALISRRQEENMKQNEPVNSRRDRATHQNNQDQKDILDGLAEEYRRAVARRVTNRKMELMEEFLKGVRDACDRLVAFDQPGTFPYSKPLQGCISIAECCVVGAREVLVQQTEDLALCDREVNWVACVLWAEYQAITNIVKKLQCAVQKASTNSPKVLFSVKCLTHSVADLVQKRSFYTSLLKSYDELLQECQSLPYSERDSFADEVGKQQAHLGACIAETMGISDAISSPTAEWPEIVNSLRARYVIQRMNKRPGGVKLLLKNMMSWHEKELGKVCNIIIGRHPGTQWAFFLCQNGTYYYSLAGQSRREHIPPLLSLIMTAFYKEFRKPLVTASDLALPGPEKKKIDLYWMPVVYTNYTLSPGENDFLSFHAHSDYVSTRLPLLDRQRRVGAVGAEKNAFFTDEVVRIYSLLCIALMATRWGLRNMTNCVSAILVGPDGTILTYAVNTVLDSEHQTQHAEANMMWKYKGEIPRGFHAFTSLKSCKSCAGIMHQALDDFNGILVYEWPDDGCRAIKTCADRFERYFPLHIDSEKVIREYDRTTGTAAKRQEARRETFSEALRKLSEMCGTISDITEEEQTALKSVSTLLEIVESDH